MMRKDVVYSIRMSILVRESLKRAARKERRTVASLLDKIIFDYLEKEQYLLPTENGSGRREFLRQRITLPAIATMKVENKPKTFPCVILDIGMGGVLISFSKSSKINLNNKRKLPHFELSFKLPQSEDKFQLQCNTRRIIEKDGDMQIGAVIRKPDEEALKQLKNYLIY